MVFILFQIQASFNQFVPIAPNDSEIASILCGKEFGIAHSTDGKTFYYGKSCSIGLKSVGRSPYLKLNELIISKISKTLQISLGHEGLHALFLNEDGNVYFAGEQHVKYTVCFTNLAPTLFATF